MGDTRQGALKRLIAWMIGRPGRGGYIGGYRGQVQISETDGGAAEPGAEQPGELGNARIPWLAATTASSAVPPCIGTTRRCQTIWIMQG